MCSAQTSAVKHEESSRIKEILSENQNDSKKSLKDSYKESCKLESETQYSEEKDF